MDLLLDSAWVIIVIFISVLTFENLNCLLCYFIEKYKTDLFNTPRLNIIDFGQTRTVVSDSIINNP